MNKKIILILSIPIILFVVFSHYRDSNNVAFVGYDKVYISIGDSKVLSYIADDKEKAERGLGGIYRLDEGQGMLFSFENILDKTKYLNGQDYKKEKSGIWMKDMKFPIDIVWINHSLEIVGIKENASPYSYPEIFYSKGDFLYVLELSSGFLAKNSIKVGQKIKFL